MNSRDRLPAALIDWYDRSRRDLPWRAAPGERADPYAVWLSEIMLQQTTVAAVGRYFRAFMERWPSVEALAAADEQEVMRAWAGLGYYARARNLLKCARLVAGDLAGRFPDSEKELLKLPGIGPYTAAAIAAIAFDRPATAVDGNVERVVARLFAVKEPLPGAKRSLRDHARSLTPCRRPGDFAQAMMDLGATICTPRRPGCDCCPLSSFCAARAAGIADLLPYRAARTARPTRYGVAFWVERSDGAVLLRRRPARGLLGGMTEIPSTAWTERECEETRIVAEAPVHGSWAVAAGLVEHTFTHFRLRLAVWRCNVGEGADLRDSAAPERCFWVDRRALGHEALPSVMRKVVSVAATG